MPIIIPTRRLPRPLPGWAEIVDQLQQKQERIQRRIEVLKFAMRMMTPRMASEYQNQNGNGTG